MNDIFQYKSPNFQKLIGFGFQKMKDGYRYATTIVGGQFELHVWVFDNGEVKTQVIDLGTDEPYTLHLVESAEGTFVGTVRADYARVLEEIAEACFENDVFKGDIAHHVIRYVRERYGDELEFLWKTFPSNAIWRRKDNQKWYGILLTLSKRKLGLDSDEVICVIDLRIDPQLLPKTVDGKKYFPGYHMNKKSWFTMCLDGSVSEEEICAWLDKSYLLAGKK